MKMPIQVCVFDVNETLLDLTPLEQHFEDWFQRPVVMREWFAQLVLYSQTLTLSGRYLDFGELAVAVLEMVARVHSKFLPSDAGQTLRSTIVSLPAHKDVEPALERLRGAGMRLVTLTNSGAEAQRRQLHHAGIAELFERQFSVETVRAFKPARSTYESVAEAMNVNPSEMIMVACHPWDLIGARAADYKTGFVGRSGNALLLVGEAQATHEGKGLTELVDQMLACANLPE